MNTRIAAPSAFVLLCGTPVASAQAPAGEVQVSATPEPGGAAASVQASVEIAAPPATIYAIMTDCAAAMRMVRNLRACRVLERDPAGRWDIREHRLRWTTLMPPMRNVFRSEYQPDRSIRFARTAGDLKANEGEWTLEPLRGGAATQVRYRARVALNAPVPSSVVRNGLNRDVPEMLRNLRRESLAAVARGRAN